MIKVAIAGGMIPIVLGIYIFGVYNYFFAPLFLIALGVSIISLSKPSKLTLYLLGAALALFVISYLIEPRWLEPLLGKIS